MSFHHLLLVLVVVSTFVTGEELLSVSMGLRGHNGCPKEMPNAGSPCTSEGKICDYEFVYFPTFQQLDSYDGEFICTLPYTSCTPLSGCSCVDVDGEGTFGWVCWSASIAACSNDIFASEPEPKFTYMRCSPKKKKFPLN